MPRKRHDPNDLSEMFAPLGKAGPRIHVAVGKGVRLGIGDTVVDVDLKDFAGVISSLFSRTPSTAAVTVAPRATPAAAASTAPRDREPIDCEWEPVDD